MDILQIRQQLATHHQDSFAWALRCCAGNRQEAEDLLQSSYLKILEQKARYRQQQAQFKTWLFTIIRNTAVDFYRKKSPHVIQLNEALNGNIESFIDADTGLQTDETQAIFKEMLTQLSAQQQQVLHLVFYQDMSIEEAAKVMGITTGTARTHYERGKKQLRKKLKQANLTRDLFNSP
jgi:RNA polymerase sigma-70 factor (ECF subfamily)